ncbi:tripartite tricarboxylate transporter substrate binding protein [Sinosporangium siamense]|uniref:tripartite tricarboxylate transporter substrate binding protein n=1 Tax=Sinosporangium siamense TaxID=1367973 RepID=UPI001EF1DDC2|nr:tripartite tricarboxylate transporter substrate binding protein [Sinosporangium siamense]
MAVSLAALTACSGTGSGSGSAALRIMVPAAPGGGWDQTSRQAEAALKSLDSAPKVEVFNVPGAGGTIGLAQLAGEKGNGNMLMTMGLVMVGAIETNKSAVTLSQTTPIARLTEEYEMIVVPANSPYKTTADFVTAWKKDPPKLSIAGGSLGGTDHIVAGLMAEASGIDPKQVNYIAHSGGGEAVTAVLSGKASAAISGVGEFLEYVENGKLIPLAVTSAERIRGVDAPTLKEGGLDVVLTNWRGMVAPNGISDADKKKLTDIVTKMHASPAWKDTLAKNNWVDAFQAGPEFATYLQDQEKRVKGIISRMGIGS